MERKIEINPNIHFGKPCIAGTRITVENILELVNEGISFTEIVKDYYPDIQVSDIQNCTKYAINIVKAEEIYLAVPA